MGLLERAARDIPMGTAYAVWGGIGAAGTVLVGISGSASRPTSVRILLLLALIACIVGLRLTAA